MHALDLGGFLMESAVIEIRYGEAYLIWDRSGQLWSVIEQGLPGIRPKTAQPDNVVFQLNTSIELSVGMARATVIHHRPKDLEQLQQTATVVFDEVARTLQVQNYTRVGLRLAFWKPTKTSQEAANLLVESGLVAPVKGNPLSKGADLSGVEYMTRWESKTAGVTIAVRTQSRRLNVDIPLKAAHLVEVKEPGEQHGLLIDLDYYTRGIVTADQLRPRVWVDQANQAARRALQTVY